MSGLEELLEVDPSTVFETDRWALGVHTEKWKFTHDGIWTIYSCAEIPRFGWKIHVSSILDDAPDILAITSKIAFQNECAFKHLSGADSFRTLHFKNASRLQSGKFIALYPQTDALAAIVLEQLYGALKQCHGLDILTDRPYRGSSNIYYRWGAFYGTGRLNGKGEPEELVPNGLGEMVPDVRLPRFVLPDGIVDPFIDAPTETTQFSPPQTVSLDQFRIDNVLRFTNAGGRYRGICEVTGLDVVVKEARPNTGFVGNESAIPRLHHEVEMIKKANSAFSDLAPPIVKEFTVNDHYYVALEYLPGTQLSEWIARENPLYSSLHQSPKDICSYLNRSKHVLVGIWENLRQLHGVGLAFGDLSVGNVIIDEDDNARFIDFESCTNINDFTLGLRTPDFCLLKQDGKVAAKDRDIYAFHCIAVSLVLRLTTLAEISDYVLEAVTTDLEKVLNEVPEWWLAACKYLTSTSRRYSPCKALNFLPPPIDTSESRSQLRQMISTAALECYRPDKEFQFPTSAAALKGAFLSFGSGTSGILRAVKTNGLDIDQDIIADYSKAAIRAVESGNLPLNYDVGLAGIGETCTVLGLDDVSEKIFDTIRRGWSNVSNPSLALGLTGISLAFLRRGNLTLAQEVMARAIRMADEFDWEKNGLLYGRSGVIAGACQFDTLLKGSSDLGEVVRKLINEEVAQTEQHPKGNSLSLRGEVSGTRLLPYLSDGTAGLLLALNYAHQNRDIDFDLSHEDVIMLSADLGTPFMLEGSLMDGASGLAIALEITRHNFPEIVDRIPEPAWHRLQKYLLPYRSGISVLHPKSLKFDFSHSQGSIGILEALLWHDGMAEINICGLYIPARIVAS